MIKKGIFLLIIFLFLCGEYALAQEIHESYNEEYKGIDERNTEVINNYKPEDSIILPFIRDGYLYSFSLIRALPLWRFFLGGDLENPFVVTDKNIYVYDIYNKVYSINKRNGDILWVYNSDDELIGKPQVFYNYLILISNTGKVIVLDSESGKVEIIKDMHSDIVDRLVFAERCIIVTYKEGSIEAFDIYGNSTLWKFSTDGLINVSPVLDKDTLFFGTWDDNFYALNVPDGSLKWISYVGSPVTRRFLVFDKSIVLFLSDGELISLNRDSGNIEWVKYFKNLDFDYNYFKGDNKIYIIEPELNVYDPDTGNLMFTYRNRVFKLYKEMLFENMVEGKYFIDEKERERLLKEKYFVLNSFPTLPIMRKGKYVYFIGEDDNLYVYDLEKDFFVLKYSFDRG